LNVFALILPGKIMGGYTIYVFAGSELPVVKMPKIRQNGTKSVQTTESTTSFDQAEQRIMPSLEHQLHEIKVVSYVTLLLAAILVALVLGMLLRASGV